MLLLHPGVPLAPHDLWGAGWLRAWSADPFAVAPLAIAGVLHAVGTRRLWRAAGTGRGLSRTEVATFWSGWLVLALALVSPLHRLGGALFSAHMTQHELLMVVAAPLLVLGRPMIAWVWALPPAWRRGAGGVARLRPVAGTWSTLTAPGTAWSVHTVALFAWHVPALYQATLRSDAVHAAQHASFFGTGLLFWWSLLRLRRATRGAAVAWLFGATIVTGALGALIAMSRTLWYPAYAATSAPWGLMPLEDQQLGGIIMWMPGGLSYLLAALWLMSGWLREPSAGAAAGPTVAVTPTRSTTG
jgi:cytochrome c oxidase assembly factor CtaG